MRRALKIALVLVALFGLAGLGGFLFLRRSGLPQRSGVARLAGLGAAVEVRWDRWGVPQVTAGSGRDLAAALGWLHANDRLFQMELGRRAAAGRLSEVLGERTLGIDRALLALRMRPAAERLWEAMGPESKAWLDGYASGVNAWLAARGTDLPPELRLLGIRPEPWLPVDSLSFIFLMARDLSFWDDRPEEKRFQWLRAFGPEIAAELIDERGGGVPPAIAALAAAEPPRELPVPAAGAAATAGTDEDALLHSGGGSIWGELAAVLASTGVAGTNVAGDAAAGSNNWIVGASRSASRSPLVANDPHLALRLPGVWYQVLLRAPDYEASGVTLPGLPGVVIGRTARLAWAFTNVMLDDHDLFFEQLDPSGTRVRRGENWLPIESRPVTIHVKGGEDVPLVLRSTDRGPLLEADAERGLPVRSLAWTAYESADPVAALLALARAGSVDEVPAAIAPYACPAQNLLVADRDGHLLQTILGRLPLRRAGDGRFPSPGWDPTYGWDGLRPASDNPVRRAPADDLLWTANHDTWGAARPAYLEADFDSSHRARRIRELLTTSGGTDGERHDLTPSALVEVQTDVTSLYARDLIAALRGEYQGEAGAAYRALAAWDGTMALRGPAALFVLVERELRRAIFADEAAARHLQPFDSRERLLGELTGRIDPVFFDDVSTPARETAAETTGAALAAAWREGTRRFGADLASWPYGELHALTLSHPLGAVPVLGRWFDRGPLPLPGSATTVEAFGAVWRGDRQAVTYGPSMRWVTDLANPDATLATLPSGQSGHPGDLHYDDQLPLYLSGEMHPVAWSEEAVARATVATLRLTP